MSSVTSAIILAGGKGERLRPYTNDRPKPMVEVGGRPILEYQLTQLKKEGVTQVVFACSYQKESLMNFVGDGKKYGLQVYYSIEESPLGRGGGIKQAMKHLKGDWDNVIVTNGDNLWRIDIKALVEKHLSRKAIATLVIVPLKSPYGIVEFNKKDEVEGFKEKPFLPHWINAGVYVFSNEIMAMLPDIGDHETETFPKLDKEHFLVFQSKDYWRGVDTVKDLNEAEKEVEEVFKDL